MRTRRYLALLGTALALGTMVRLAVHGELSTSDPTFNEPLLDARVFLDWAARIAGGEWVGEGAFFFNPLYAYLLAPLSALFGDGLPGAVRLIQGLLGLATVLLMASTARRLLGRREAAITALLGALWPVLVFFEEILIGATLGVFLNALSLHLLARWRTRPTRGRLLGVGAALGFAVLGRPNVILFPAALPFWMRRVFPPGKWGRRTAAAAGLLFCGVALPLLPTLVRNLAVLGEPVVTTTSMGVNLHLTNNPLAWATGRMDSGAVPFNPFLLEGASRTVAEGASGRSLSPAEVSSWWTRRALRDCSREPGRASLFLLRKALYFCGSHEIPSSDSFAQGKRDSWLLRLLSWPLAFGLLLPLALIGSVAVLRRRRRALPLVLLAAVYAFGLVIFFPLSHYRLPVLPALIPLAAAGVVDLHDALRGRRGARSPWRWGLVLGAALLCHGNLLAGAAGMDALGPFSEPGSWIYANRAQALVGRAAALGAAGDSAGREEALRLAEDQARRALATSATWENGRWLVFAAFARIGRARGDWEEEGRRLDEALAIAPGQPQLRADKVLNLVRRRRLEEARRLAGEIIAAGGALEPRVKEALGLGD